MISIKLTKVNKTITNDITLQKRNFNSLLKKFIGCVDFNQLTNDNFQITNFNNITSRNSEF